MVAAEINKQLMSNWKSTSYRGRDITIYGESPIYDASEVRVIIPHWEASKFYTHQGADFIEFAEHHPNSDYIRRFERYNQHNVMRVMNGRGEVILFGQDELFDIIQHLALQEFGLPGYKEYVVQDARIFDSVFVRLSSVKSGTDWEHFRNLDLGMVRSLLKSLEAAQPFLNKPFILRQGVYYTELENIPILITKTVIQPDRSWITYISLVDEKNVGIQMTVESFHFLKDQLEFHTQRKHKEREARFATYDGCVGCANNETIKEWDRESRANR